MIVSSTAYRRVDAPVVHSNFDTRASISSISIALARAIEDCLGRPYLDRRGRVRIDHCLQQSRSRRRGPLLQPRDRLAERLASDRTVSRLEFGYLEPAQERIASDTGGIAASSMFR